MHQQPACMFSSMRQPGECFCLLFRVCPSACSHSNMENCIRWSSAEISPLSPSLVRVGVPLHGRWRGAWPWGQSSDGEMLLLSPIHSSCCPLKLNERPLHNSDFFVKVLNLIPCFFVHASLFAPTYVTFVSQSIPVLAHNSSRLSSRRDAVEYRPVLEGWWDVSLLLPLQLFSFCLHLFKEETFMRM